MAINQSLDARLESAMSAEDVVTEALKPVTNEPTDGAPVQQNLVFEEYEPVAGTASLVPKVKELIKPIIKKEARMVAEPKILPDPPAINPAPVTPAPVSPKPVTKPSIAPIPADEAAARVARREQLIEQGNVNAAPSPTVTQIAEGVEVSPISTLAFDNEGLQATIRANSEAALKTDSSMSVRSIYMRMINAGVPEKQAERILAGAPLESSVGDSELAKTVAGIVHLHDESAKQIDVLMEKMSKRELNYDGQLQLRQQVAFHDLITRNLKGVSIDVGRTMNVFKRVQDTGPGLKGINIRQVLDNAGGEDALLQLAKDYMDMPTQKAKNRLLEAGLGKRLRDAWIYVWQSNLLTDITPHAFSFVSGVLQGAAAPVERMVAIPIGMARTTIAESLGRPYINDRFFMGDVQARVSGFIPGIFDAFETLSKGGPKLKIPGVGEKELPLPFYRNYGVADAAKGDAPFAPLSAEAFSDAPIRMFGREFRTPDITDTFIGRAIDTLGYIYSVPFRSLKAADDMVGLTVGRMQMHEESYHIVQKEYDNLIASSYSPDDALKEAQRISASHLTERPMSMQANIDSARKQATMTEDFNRETALNEFYWKTNKIFNNPFLKPFLPFSKSLTNEFIETAARTPGPNLISPRFWDSWNKGGRDRDLAMARLTLGGTAGWTAWQMSTNNRITGSGPSDVQDKKALEALGWQKYSFVFGPGELSPENANALTKLTNITPGKGPLEGYTFVNHARFGPYSPVLAMGADIGDAQKFYDGRPDETEWSRLALAYSGANMEYIKNLPSAAAIGDLVSILRTRNEDGGNKVVEVLTRIAKQYADVLYTGTPIIGSTNATGLAHIERLTDPEVRSTRVDEMNVPEGLRLVYEQLNRVKSRLPGYSRTLPSERDDIGNKKFIENNMFESYANFLPFVQAKEGKRSPYWEAMASINHGPSRPKDIWEGVRLTATQYNRYKELYGQEVKIDPSLFVETSVGAPMNYESAIPKLLKDKEKYEIDNGRTFGVGDAQKFTDNVLKKYRRIAKLRMVGFDPSPELTQEETPDLTENGFINEKVEFPELKQEIEKSRKFYSVYGK